MNTQDDRVGICAVCGTIHANNEGFTENRTCSECGEDKVFSIVEYRDIALDWQRLKDEVDTLTSMLAGEYY